ncbi:MAG: M56 family metallopeptidase [Bacteroidetes bacterium]|nr:M56 family metallopeptidase [Bacteroidota bacterium]
MSQLELLSSHPLIQSLGQTIIHSLWQGTAITLLCWLILCFIRKDQAQARYWIHSGGIVSIFLIAVFTFINLYQSSVFDGASPGHEFPGFRLILIQIQSFEGQEVSNFSEVLSNSLPYISILWLAGLMVFSVRLIGGYSRVQKLKSSGIALQSMAWQLMVQRISERMNLGIFVEIKESAKIFVPTLIGHAKPILLFPFGALASMPVSQVEAIISHELAHVKRHDYLINLLLSFVEVVFFFHPAVWYLQSQVKNNRELACDDLAISITRDPANYAKALAHVQDNLSLNVRLSPAFSGRKGQLLKRIKRISMKTQVNSNKQKRTSFAGLFILTAIVIIFTSSIQSPFPVNSQNLSEISAQEADTTVHTKIEFKGKMYEVVLTWNDAGTQLLKLDGKEIAKKDYKKYSEIIQAAKKIADIEVEEIELEEIELEELELEEEIKRVVLLETELEDIENEIEETEIKRVVLLETELEDIENEIEETDIQISIIEDLVDEVEIEVLDYEIETLVDREIVTIEVADIKEIEDLDVNLDRIYIVTVVDSTESKGMKGKSGKTYHITTTKKDKDKKSHSKRKKLIKK